MEYPDDISDAASELLMAWTLLDNIRLDVIPSFARNLESLSRGVVFPSDIKEVETYTNAERAELLQSQATEAATLEERTCIATENLRSFAEILLMQCQERLMPLAQLESQFEYALYELLVEVANHRRTPTTPDPMRDYNAMQTNLRRASHQARLFACFYKSSIRDISISIFQYVVPQELKSAHFSLLIHFSPFETVTDPPHVVRNIKAWTLSKLEIGSLSNPASKKYAN